MHLGGKYHNLALDGDVDISGTHTMIAMGTSTGAGTSIDACLMGMADSGATGNKFIFGGSGYQNVKFSTDIVDIVDQQTGDQPVDRTLMIAALTIDKSGGAVEFNEGAAGVDVAYLEPLNGALSTGSEISGGPLLGIQTGGAIVFTGGNGMVANPGTGGIYGSPPSSVVYDSGTHTIGAERDGAGDITVLSDDVITINGKSGKITNLNMYTGTLKVLNELEVTGTIFLDNRASFVAGAVSRKVAHGDQGMGSVKGGYLFPVGTLSETRNRYRPLILSFATDVSPEEVTVTTTSYSGEVTWPSAGITTALTEGGTYTLNTYAPIMWMVEFSGIPALGATVRVAADGLVGVNDSNGLRLVQWDCDGTNVRLAGEFDLSASCVDPSSVSANGRINGVPNTTMDGVDAAECSIVGIAANYADNPIGTAPPAATPMANVQLIHNIVGVTVDVYVDDVRVVDDFAFQTATPLSTQIAAGQHAVHVVPANAPDNSSALVTIPVVLAADGMYTVIANGDALNFDFKMLSNTRSESVADGKVEFRIVHGAGSLGEVDLRSLTEAGRWTNNLSFNQATGYRTAEVIVHNLELLDGHTQIDVFELDLGDYINQTLVLALSGTGMSSAQGLTLMGVATDGSVIFPQVVTSAETEELPSEFALQGNYPNPFNPSTQIQFVLPSTADVEIQVIDLLGLMVLNLPSQSVEAGANRTVELDGSSLASGTYLYRLIAKMESGVQVETGRMVLIK